MDFNYKLVILFILLLLLIVVVYIEYLRWKEFANTTFKVLKITDNLGNSHFKIVGKNLKGDFQELKHFYAYRNSIPKELKKSTGQSFLGRKEARVEYKKLIFHIGKMELYKMLFCHWFKIKKPEDHLMRKKNISDNLDI